VETAGGMIPAVDGPTNDALRAALVARQKKDNSANIVSPAPTAPMSRMALAAEKHQQKTRDKKHRTPRGATARVSLPASTPITSLPTACTCDPLVSARQRCGITNHSQTNLLTLQKEFDAIDSNHDGVVDRSVSSSLHKS
jgi:hypothetical protein